MADKEPAGSQDEPTPADDRVDPRVSPTTGNGDSAPDEPSDGSREESESTAEPSNDELAESDAASAGDPADDTNGHSNGAKGKDREPVTVGAATAGGKRGAAKAARTESEAKADKAENKGRATRKRDTKEPAKKRTTPVAFVRESVGELRKVVYPTGQQLVNYFVVVLIFVLFVIAYVSLLDLGFGAAMFQIFA